MTRKTCSKCSVTKPTSEFHKCKASRDGLQYRCKSCCSEYSKQHKLNTLVPSLRGGLSRDNKEQYHEVKLTNPSKDKTTVRDKLVRAVPIIPPRRSKSQKELDKWIKWYQSISYDEQKEIDRELGAQFAPRHVSKVKDYHGPKHSRKAKLALNNFTYKKYIKLKIVMDEQSFLDKSKPNIVSFLSKNRNNKNSFGFKVVLRKDVLVGDPVYVTRTFTSEPQVNVRTTNVNELYNIAKDQMLKKFYEFVEMGSQWKLHEIVNLGINATAYQPLRGRSYIELSPKLANTKSIINMKNDDDQCFKWSVTRALNPVEKNAERVSKILRLQAEKYIWPMEFPVKLDDIQKFEKANNISINVYGTSSSRAKALQGQAQELFVLPLHITAKVYNKHVNLMFLDNGK